MVYTIKVKQHQLANLKEGIKFYYKNLCLPKKIIIQQESIIQIHYFHLKKILKIYSLLMKNISLSIEKA